MLPEICSSSIDVSVNQITPYHYCQLQSAISHLRPEGREIVAIVLSGPAEMYDWSAPQITPKSHHLKLYLKALGWSDKKIKSGFNDIKRMLQEI